MKIIIIKHGETEENAKKVCTGHLGGNLSEKGKTEARELGGKFKDKNIDAVYSSDLARAIKTAEEILKFYPELKLIQDKRLRERSFGNLEGKPWPKDLDWKNLPADVETEDSMQQRSDDFITEIRDKHEKQTVLIICHDGIRVALISSILGKKVLWQDVTKETIHEFNI